MEKLVKAFGNGGHIVVPKEHIGKKAKIEYSEIEGSGAEMEDAYHDALLNPPTGEYWDTLDDEEKETVPTLTKEAQPITNDDAIDYADFLRKEFKRWEKSIFSWIDDTLKDEVPVEKMVTVNKTFGEFLQNLFNTINTKDFIAQIKKVIKLSLTQGKEQAEQEIQTDVTVNFDRSLDFLANRQIDGFYIDGKRWKGLKGVSMDAQADISMMVQQGISERKGTTQIKKDIKKYMTQLIGGEVEGKVTEGRTMRIARTEVNRFHNAGRYETYKDSGLKGKMVWNAFVDDRTSPICRRLNNQKVDVGEEFTDKEGEWLHPPAHPNCRSIVEFVPE